MTEPDPQCCAACGRPAPIESKQHDAYHVSFIAPAGVYRDIIIAETPQEALAQARIKVQAQALPAEEFEPVADYYCVRQIIIEHTKSLTQKSMPARAA
jgi:hypothetical protein